VTNDVDIVVRIKADAPVLRPDEPVPAIRCCRRRGDVSCPRVLLGIWLVLTIGWLGLAGYDLYMRWPEYYVFYKRPDGLLIGAMVRKDLTESLEFALIPPIVLLLIGCLVLWAVRGPRR
jgi:hypothetical protein